MTFTSPKSKRPTNNLQNVSMGIVLDPFWELKSFKNNAQKPHDEKEDLHVTLWARWGGRVSPERGAPTDLGPQDCPPARAVSIDYSLRSMAFCDKWAISPIGYRSFIGYSHRPRFQHAARRVGGQIYMYSFFVENTFSSPGTLL